MSARRSRPSVSEKKGSGRRRLRTLVQTDSPAVSLGSPPVGLTLGRGRLEVDFANMEELAAAMYWLARALDGDLEGFAKEYEPASKVENSRS